jgi:hypothetical protein
MILDLLHFFLFGPAPVGEVSYAVAPLVGAALVSGGTQLLSGLLSGIGKSKNKRKAMEFLMQALEKARSADAANQQRTAQNLAGVSNFQNRFEQDVAGLRRERLPPNLSGLFAASESNPFQSTFQTQQATQAPVSFSPTGQAPGASTPPPGAPPALPPGGQGGLGDLLALLQGGGGRGPGDTQV